MKRVQRLWMVILKHPLAFLGLCVLFNIHSTITFEPELKLLGKAIGEVPLDQPVFQSRLCRESTGKRFSSGLKCYFYLTRHVAWAESCDWTLLQATDWHEYVHVCQRILHTWAITDHRIMSSTSWKSGEDTCTHVHMKVYRFNKQWGKP